MSDILIVYYSRSGRTRLLAEKLAALLDADLAEIKERKDRRGALGFIGAACTNILRRPVELTDAPPLGDHRTVILGTPVWTFGLSAPVRRYVRQTDFSGRTVCAFSTTILVPGKLAFRTLNRLLPRQLAKTFNWARPGSDDPKFDLALGTWAEEIQTLASPVESC